MPNVKYLESTGMLKLAGDIGGSPEVPKVVGLKGVPLQDLPIPEEGQVLVYSGENGLWSYVDIITPLIDRIAELESYFTEDLFRLGRVDSVDLSVAPLAVTFSAAFPDTFASEDLRIFIQVVSGEGIVVSDVSLTGFNVAQGVEPYECSFNWFVINTASAAYTALGITGQTISQTI